MKCPSIVYCATFLLVAAASSFAQTADRRLVREPVPSAGRRLALVVGNDAYPSAPLQNAVFDARSVSTALRELGFVITLVENANRATFAAAIARVEDALRPDDVVLFYFAGHGMQIGGENYLIPVDFIGNSGASARLTALAASDVQEALRRARISLLVFDACRNNPFSGQRGSLGLAPMEARGSLVAFATGAGQTASDNPASRNGLFTEVFLKTLRETNLGARDLFYKVRQQVNDLTGGRQFPAVYDGLLGDVALRGEIASASQAAATANSRQSDPNNSLDPRETALWEEVQKSGRPADYEAYLQQYPNGVFAALARNRAAPAATTGPTASETELALWKAIENSSKVSDFRAYLETYPRGGFALLATSRISAIEERASADAELARKKMEEAEARGNVIPVAYIRGFHFCWGHLSITKDGLNFHGPEADFQFSKASVKEWKAGGYGMGGAAVPKIGFQTMNGEKYSFHLVTEDDVQHGGGQIRGGRTQPFTELVQALLRRWGLKCPDDKVCTVPH